MITLTPCLLYRFDGRFAQALKEYSDLGVKKDGVFVNVGDLELITAVTIYM